MSLTGSLGFQARDCLDQAIAATGHLQDLSQHGIPSGIYISRLVTEIHQFFQDSADNMGRGLNVQKYFAEP